MIPVYIDWRDGHFSMVRLDRPGLEQWPVTTTVTPELWAAYEQHIDAARLWYRIIGALDNEAADKGE